MPVYGNPTPSINRQQAARLADAQPSPQTRTQAEVQEALADALAIEGLDELLKGAVEARRRELVAERERMRDQMHAVEGAQPAGWLQGIDDLSPGSFDLLTVAVLFPA